MNADPLPLIVTDSTALIGLERIGRLDILPAIFPEVIAPPAVVEEFGRRPDWLIVELVKLPIALAALRDKLDFGEAEAIALALKHPDCSLLIDERRGRKVAKELGIDLIGTFGVLLLAKKRGIVATVKPLMDALIDSEFRVSAKLYEQMLQLAGE